MNSPTPPSWHHTLVSLDILHRHFFHKRHRKVFKTLIDSLLPGDSKTVLIFLYDHPELRKRVLNTQKNDLGLIFMLLSSFKLQTDSFFGV
jgi:hypothetical protein